MQSELFTILKRIVIFFLLLACLDLLIGRVINVLFDHQKTGELYKRTYLLNSKDELLIFGSSSANHHYIPSIFSDSLKMSCFNAGDDGQSIFYHDAMLAGLLSKHHPKVIILGLEESDYVKTEIEYSKDRLFVLLPYCRKEPALKSTVLSVDEWGKIKFLSTIYPNNSQLFTIFSGFLGLNRKITDGGYVPLYNEMQKELGHEPDVPMEADTAKVKSLESFLKKAAAVNCRVFAVISPKYVIRANPDLYFQVRPLLDKYKVRMFYHEQDSLFLADRSLFSDSVHMNDKGARIFSSMVAHEIRQALAR